MAAGRTEDGGSLDGDRSAAIERGEVLPFTLEAFQEYIDLAIRVWREKREQAETGSDKLVADCYIDAFQSVRTTVIGETLPAREKVE